jgi:hypothetical protein
VRLGVYDRAHVFVEPLEIDCTTWESGGIGVEQRMNIVREAPLARALRSMGIV